MESFATVDDLKDRCGQFDTDQETRAVALLADATTILEGEFRAAGREIDLEDDLQAESLKLVCCSMVRRVLASAKFQDVKQYSMTAGPFSEQATFVNPSGNLYVTQDERRLLGIPKRRVRIGSIAPTIGGKR